jgi:hypothetical protein
LFFFFFVALVLLFVGGGVWWGGGGEGQYFCSAVCPVIKLSNFYFLAEAINVGLESHFLFPPFPTSPRGWFV